jgi:choline dehydrogenase-like flavoprotein
MYDRMAKVGSTPVLNAVSFFLMVGSGLLALLSVLSSATRTLKAETSMAEFDFVIVGAGSAGAAVADRLSESGKYSVCVLEAGGSDLNFWIWVPVGYGKAFYNKHINWMYDTEPDPGLNNREGYWPRGKVLGGSSSINAMVYIRGQHADFEDWKAMGNPGWGWDDVLPYFKRSETNDAGADEFRGGDGPLHVSSVDKHAHPLCQNFFRASEQAGFKFNPDFNGADQDGVGHYQITTKGGFRMSTARAYLSRAKKRPNVTILTKAHTKRVLIWTATGQLASSMTRMARADRHCAPRGDLERRSHQLTADPDAVRHRRRRRASSQGYRA